MVPILYKTSKTKRSNVDVLSYPAKRYLFTHQVMSSYHPPLLTQCYMLYYVPSRFRSFLPSLGRTRSNLNIRVSVYVHNISSFAISSESDLAEHKSKFFSVHPFFSA